MLFWIFFSKYIYITNTIQKQNIYICYHFKLYLYEYNRLYEYEIILFEIMINEIMLKYELKYKLFTDK